MNNPGLRCSVTSCAHNRHGSDCALQKVTVAPCQDRMHAHSGHESMCSSYQAK